MKRLILFVRSHRLPAIFLVAILVMLIVLASSRMSERRLGDTGLSILDLPPGAVFVEHNHPTPPPGDDAEFKKEMDHYATPEAVKAGGPIYGVYGFSIVSVEYEIPESMIGTHMVGKEFPGWGLAQTILGTRILPPYDHFHVGIKDDTHDGHDHVHEKAYIIHYMLLPHEDELALGLSCG